jgi:hypothetical protein
MRAGFVPIPPTWATGVSLAEKLHRLIHGSLTVTGHEAEGRFGFRRLLLCSRLVNQGARECSRSLFDHRLREPTIDASEKRRGAVPSVSPGRPLR